MNYLEELLKAKEAIVAFPEASVALFAVGLAIGWAVSLAFSHKELKVTRIIISELRQPNISQATRDRLLESAPRRRGTSAWLKSLGAILIAAIVGATVAVMLQPKAPVDLSRHLSGDQKNRMIQSLKLSPDESYSIQINSLPNCDECEVYAQELRDLVQSIPRWKAGGSALLFTDPNAPRTGLQLILSDKAMPDVGKKLLAAFAAADVPLTPRPSEAFQQLDAVIVVARRPK
jgi:hypothetical protein